MITVVMVVVPVAFNTIGADAVPDATTTPFTRMVALASLAVAVCCTLVTVELTVAVKLLEPGICTGDVPGVI